MARVRACRRLSTRRRGAAAAELAALLPLLVFLVVFTVDFARVFYYSTTLANCARNGAAYESDPYGKRESPYANVTEAALADAPDLTADPSNKPTVATATGTDAEGRSYVEVTVKYKFRTVSAFPGVPSEQEISRTVRMVRAPLNPS